MDTTTYVFLVEDLGDASFLIENLACCKENEPYDDEKLYITEHTTGNMVYLKNYNGSKFDFWQVEFGLPTGFSSVSWLKKLIKDNSKKFPWDAELVLVTLEEKSKFTPDLMWSRYNRRLVDLFSQ